MSDRVPSKQKLAFGRSLSDFGLLSDAEKKLIDCAARGVECVLGENVPLGPSPEIAIRPELIRFLAMGGDYNAPLHEKGIYIHGAYIGAAAQDEAPRALDLEGAKLASSLWLWNCRFDAPIVLLDSEGRGISLDGSAFPGIRGDRIKLSAGFFLREVQSVGIVRLLGANIAGDLDCTGGHFENGAGPALSCDGARIGGTLFLSWGFHAKGEVRIPGVVISHDLNCEGGHFENPAGTALSCQRAMIGGVLFFRGEVRAEGIVSLAHTAVATLFDNVELWPINALQLDGFRYERIAVGAALDAGRRVKWLEKQESGFLGKSTLARQPWIQLARVLREQGHLLDAAKVDIEREKRLFATEREATANIFRNWWLRWGRIDGSGQYVSVFSIVAYADDAVMFSFHWLYGRVSSYGYRPRRIVYLAVFLWLAFAEFYHHAAENALFAPSNAATVKVLSSDCAKEFGANEVVNWTHCKALLAAYPRFSPLAFSLDLILPVARLGQSSMWTPVSDGAWFSISGWTPRVVWIEQICGWVAALTLGAIATGLVKRKESS